MSKSCEMTPKRIMDDLESLRAEIGLERIKTHVLQDELFDTKIWLEHYLRGLVHVTVYGDHDRIVNGYAAAQIPDWAMRQRLDSITAALEESKKAKI